MRYYTDEQINALRNTLDHCIGYVCAIDTETGLEYDMKNSAEINNVVGILTKVNADRLEIFASKREDSMLLLHFMEHLDEFRPENQPQAAAVPIYEVLQAA